MRPEETDEESLALSREEYDCPSCGTWWWSEPHVIECEGCRDTLCPRCEPVLCECGGSFCRNCAVLLELEDGSEAYFCTACRQELSLCDHCGQAPPELLFETLGEPIQLCPACALAHLDKAA